MNYKSRFFGSTLSTLRQALVAAFTVTILLAFPVAGNAQETSSAIRGTVTDEAGRPVAGASITLRNDAVGLTRSTTSNANGEFSLRNLPIDTNYSVSVSSERSATRIPCSATSCARPSVRPSSAHLEAT